MRESWLCCDSSLAVMVLLLFPFDFRSTFHVILSRHGPKPNSSTGGVFFFLQLFMYSSDDLFFINLKFADVKSHACL